MPYSASAFGVLPPLWSRAAKKPRPDPMCSRCVTSMAILTFRVATGCSGGTRWPSGYSGVRMRQSEGAGGELREVQGFARASLAELGAAAEAVGEHGDVVGRGAHGRQQHALGARHRHRVVA